MEQRTLLEHSRYFIRRGIVRFSAVVLALGSSGACSKAESPPSGTSPSPRASASVSKVAAKAPDVEETTPIAKKANGWVPMVWEEARSAAIGREPTRREVVQRQVEPPYPDCANHDARLMLKAKYGRTYENRKKEAERQAQADYSAANREFEPLRADYEKKRQAFEKALARGLFLGDNSSTQLSSYPGPGETVALTPPTVEPPELLSVRKELSLNSGAKTSFECRVTGVQRVVRPADPRARYAGVAAKSQNVDLVVCEDRHESTSVRAVLEVPTTTVRAVVKTTGGSATVEKYVMQEIPVVGTGLRELLAQALSNPTMAPLAQRIIKVTGASQLRWYVHGAPAYARLKGLGMTGRLAIEAAEYKNVWHVSFRYACADQGLGCAEWDGLEPPSVELVEPREVETVAAQSSPGPSVKGEANPSQQGRWEAAARAAEPNLDASVGRNAFFRGFFPSPVQNAASLKTLPIPGKDSQVELLTAPSDGTLERFRQELARLGGMVPFVCDVVDFGQETNPPPWPITDAALTSKGETLDGEAPMYNIACRGDAASHTGNILVYVPAHAAWAEATRDGERATIREYHLERHGYFSDELKDTLQEVGIGSRLRISGVARLSRKASWLSVHGKRLDGPVWVTHLGKYQCPHEGLGCPRMDGTQLPAIRAEKLVRCDVKQFKYE